MVLFYKIWKKYDEIQLDKIDFNSRKMTNHPPSPECAVINDIFYMTGKHFRNTVRGGNPIFKNITGNFITVKFNTFHHNLHSSK